MSFEILIAAISACFNLFACASILKIAGIILTIARKKIPISGIKLLYHDHLSLTKKNI